VAINNPYASYQQNSITTASPGELTLMLYNGCLKFITQASKAMETSNIQEKNLNIQKAQKIITELTITLNKDYEVSKKLEAMYEYMNHRLIEANIKNDQTILKEVENYVIEFRDTWKQVIQINRQKQYGQGGQA